MKKFRQARGLKGFILGALLMAIVMVAIPTMAEAVSRQITITSGHINLEIDGEIVVPRDAAGNVVEPFVYDGTTYLPVRAIADALGMDVDWRTETSTVVLTTIVSEPAPPAPPPTIPPATPPPTPAVPPTTPPPPAATQGQGLVGTWHWEMTPGFTIPYYVLNANGTGTMSDMPIRWWSSPGRFFVCSTPATCGATCIAPTEWRYSITGNRLRLTSIILPDMYFTYIRQGAETQQPTPIVSEPAPSATPPTTPPATPTPTPTVPPTGTRITLSAGTHEVGRDVVVGRYDIIVISGGSNLFVRDADGRSRVNEILRLDDAREPSRVSNVVLARGYTIEIRGNLVVELVPSLAPTLPTVRTNVVLGAGFYVVGRDIVAGRYDVNVISGGSNFFVRDGTGRSRVNEILRLNDDRRPSRLSNVTIGNNYVIEIRGNLVVEFVPR
ncbi:MAG: copper amine oxidase N-terminal domain-containing protein [Clostridiales bacterium]|jgi:hypothetical protein|nr:copper amine oxidase N-terminal domain-containing protein [Clostridiales bacterium]